MHSSSQMREEGWAGESNVRAWQTNHFDQTWRASLLQMAGFLAKGLTKPFSVFWMGGSYERVKSF